MRTSRLIRAVLTIAVLLAFIVYFLLNTGKFVPLLHVNAGLLALIAIANIAAIAINGLFTKLILRPFNKNIPVSESFYVSLISSVGNFFAPVGAGFGFRAIYLKKRFGLSYSKYVSTLSGNYILVFLVNSLFGLLSLYMLREKSSNSQYYVLVSVFAVVFLVSLLLSIVRIPTQLLNRLQNTRQSRVIGIFHSVLQGWDHIVSHKRLMLQLVSITFTGLLLTAVTTLMIILSLHFSISLAALILLSTLSALSLFINLTPANLGVKEAIYLFSASVMGFSLNQIILIALVDRGILFLVLLALWILSPRLKKMQPVVL